jgi:hypothetical protein
MRDDTRHVHQEYLASIHYCRYVRWSACGHQGIEFGGKYSQTLRAVKRHSVHLVKKKLLYPLGPAFGRPCSCYGAGDALFGYAK